MNLLFKISILFLFYRKLMKYKMRLINHIYTFSRCFHEDTCSFSQQLSFILTCTFT